MWRALVTILLVAAALALDNGIARTPPMGWSSWNTFGCNVSEALIKEVVDSVVKLGLRDVGYEYINIDDCWFRCSNVSLAGEICYSSEDGRDAAGNLVADPIRFPNGMKALADYVHSQGLKFGLYLSSGPLTCSEFVGTWQHEAQDAASLAAWDVDYVKLDCCHTTKAMKDIAYPALMAGLNRTGRPIVYSCDTDELFAHTFEWIQSHEKPFDWAPPDCNLWRTGPDIKDHWDHVRHNANLNDRWWDLTHDADYAGPGAWNDPDMLVVGMGGQTTEQYRTHMSLWAVMASPLIMGHDVRKTDATTLSLLANNEVLAVNQDALGKQGRRVHIGLALDEIWVRPLASGDFAVVLHNPSSPLALRICVSSTHLDPTLTSAKLRVRDIWSQKDLGVHTDKFCVDKVARYESRMVRVGRE